MRNFKWNLKWTDLKRAKANEPISAEEDSNPSQGAAAKSHRAGASEDSVSAFSDLSTTHTLPLSQEFTLSLRIEIDHRRLSLKKWERETELGFLMIGSDEPAKENLSVK